MSKRFIIAIIIILLVLSFLPACTSKSGAENNKEEAQAGSYLEKSLDSELANFSENIFTFNYPSNWKIIGDREIDNLFKTSMKGSSRDLLDYIGGVYVGEEWSEDIGEAVLTIYSITDPAFSETISDEQYNNMENSYKTLFGDRLLSINKIIFNDLEAIEVKTIGKSRLTQAWSINTTVNGGAYILDLRAKKELYAGYEPIFTGIVDSFKISK